MYMLMMILTIIVECNDSNLNGQYWVIFGRELSRMCGDPSYRGPDYQGTAVCNKIQDAI
jgi:hypothetical protein